MLVLTTSPAALLNGGNPNQQMIQTLKTIRASGNAVAIISNHSKPEWIESAFAGSRVAYIKTDARQNGIIIKKIAEKLKVAPHDILVLAVKSEDVQMAKNGHAVLIGADWSDDKQVRALGLKVDNSNQLEELIQLTNGWNGSWWYKGEMPYYSVRALVNLSGYNVSVSQQAFGAKLTTTVKNGGSRLAALLTVTARSLLVDKISDAENLIWGVYPSSSNTTKQDEVLTDFCHRLRTTVSRVQFAKIGEPLFIRHKASTKRSTAGNGIDRTDPSDQIESIHINPFYRRKIENRNAVIIDDCTTHGASFGVAAAFLAAAGIQSVNGIALGKFGNKLNTFNIKINSDPFAPIQKGEYSFEQPTLFPGQTDSTAQSVIIALIP